MKKSINILLLLLIVILVSFIWNVMAERNGLQRTLATQYQKTTHSIMSHTEESLLDLDPTPRGMVGGNLYAQLLNVETYSAEWSLVADDLKNISEALLADQYSEELEVKREKLHHLFLSIKDLLGENTSNWYEAFTNRNSKVYELLSEYRNENH